MSTPRVPTPEEYNTLSPRSQGYASYMRAEWPGATIPKTNPYPSGSPEAAEWDSGQMQAVIDVQDSEE